MAENLKRKSVAYRLAWHFGCDVEEVKEYDYHPGWYSPKVYSYGNDYWSAGPRAPRYSRGQDGLKWKRVDPTDTRIGTLWIASGSEEE